MFEVPNPIPEQDRPNLAAQLEPEPLSATSPETLGEPDSTDDSSNFPNQGIQDPTATETQAVLTLSIEHGAYDDPDKEGVPIES